MWAGMGEVGTPQPPGMVLGVGAVPTTGPGAAGNHVQERLLSILSLFLIAAKNGPGKNGNQLLGARRLCVQELCRGGQSQHSLR